MDFLAKGMDIISKGMIVFGGIWTVWGIIILATGLNETNGHSIRDGVLRVFSGSLHGFRAAGHGAAVRGSLPAGRRHDL